MSATVVHSQNKIEHLRYDNAADFLAALQPHNGIWGDRPANWIFRGHENADYLLLASAHRAKSWEKFGGFDPMTATETERVVAEGAVLRKFVKALDAAGLPLPLPTARHPFSGDLEEVCTHLVRTREQPNLHWPEARYFALMALAQHYTIPTRLLDWTTNARTGAYFAALELKGGSAKDLCVWAVNGHFVIWCLRAVRGAMSCSLDRVPRASNPNLQAQWGLFTHYRSSGQDETLRTLDALVDGVMGGSIEAYKEGYWAKVAPEMHPCLLRKLILPRTEAKELMRLLHLEEVTAASVFPGPGGAAERLREQFWCGADFSDF